MNNTMPPNTATAPTTMMAAPVVLSPPPEDVVPGLVTGAGELGGTAGELPGGVAGVVVAGALGDDCSPGDCGSPGESGLPEPGP